MAVAGGGGGGRGAIAELCKPEVQSDRLTTFHLFVGGKHH